MVQMCIHFLTLCRARQLPRNRTAVVSCPRGASSLVGRKRWLHVHEHLPGSGGESCVLQDVTGGIDEPDPKDREELRGRGVVPREGVHKGSLAPGTESSELMAGLRTCSSHGEVNASHGEPHQNFPRLLQSFAQTLLSCRCCGGWGRGQSLTT